MLMGFQRGVDDGIRTRDRLDHNQELYQLSYAHHVAGRTRRRRRIANHPPPAGVGQSIIWYAGSVRKSTKSSDAVIWSNSLAPSS